jgi:hypothetical protein
VPGRGQEGIALARNVFDDIVEQAEKMYQAGVSVSEAVDRYVIPEKFGVGREEKANLHHRSVHCLGSCRRMS